MYFCLNLHFGFPKVFFCFLILFFIFNYFSFFEINTSFLLLLNSLQNPPYISLCFFKLITSFFMNCFPCIYVFMYIHICLNILTYIAQSVSFYSLHIFKTGHLVLDNQLMSSSLEQTILSIP